MIYISKWTTSYLGSFSVSISFEILTTQLSQDKICNNVRKEAIINRVYCFELLQKQLLIIVTCSLL